MIRSLIRRLADGPRCPDCPHDVTAHGEAACLGFIPDEDADPATEFLSRPCPCTRTTKEKP